MRVGWLGEREHWGRYCFVKHMSTFLLLSETVARCSLTHADVVDMA